MHRRMFLGSVIGTLATTQSDYLAIPLQCKDPGHLDVKKELTYGSEFRGFYVTNDLVIQQTPLLRIEDSPHGRVFCFDTWHVTVPKLDLTAMGICLPDGRTLYRSSIHCNVRGGDKIFGQYAIPRMIQ
jgi:hypothetical protein